MTQDFEKELKWFTQKLLQIRLLKVRGFSLLIPFELSDIKNCTVAEFNVDMSPREHLEELIEEIRGYYIKNSKNSVSRDDIKLDYSSDGLSVKIFGIDSDLLRSFIRVRLKSQTSLFETGAGNVLFYVGLSTGVVLNAAGQTVLAELRSKEESGTILLYDEIFEICARHKGDKEQPFRRRNNTKDKKDVVARGAISYLLGKIIKSKLFSSTEEKKIIENVREEGYRLMM